MQWLNSGCLNMINYIPKSWLRSSFLESLASFDSLLYPRENELSGSMNWKWNISKPPLQDLICSLCLQLNLFYESLHYILLLVTRMHTTRGWVVSRMRTSRVWVVFRIQDIKVIFTFPWLAARAIWWKTIQIGPSQLRDCIEI